MRKRIQVSTFAMLCIVLGIYGVWILISGAMGRVAGARVTEFRNITAENLENGQVVKGFVADCLKKNQGSDRKIGLMEEVSEGVVNYDVYTISLFNGEYIQFWACNDETKEFLEKVVEGNVTEGASTVSFQGKIVAKDDLDTTWYQDIKGFDESKLISDHVLRELSVFETKGITIAGIAMILFCLAVLKFGGITSRYESGLTDRTDHTDIEGMEKELQYSQDQLNKILDEERKLTLESVVGGILLLVGLGYAFFSPFYPVIGWLFVAVGIRKLWVGFINSNHGAAEKIADHMNLSTIQTRKTMHEQFIYELDYQIKKEKEKKEALMRLR